MLLLAHNHPGWPISKALEALLAVIQVEHAGAATAQS